MSEFTGERVIPGLVDENLMNEHLARYRFATRFIEPGASVLDAGCGSGYGSAELARHGRVTAFDIAPDAMLGNQPVTFLAANCDALPFADASFDLIACFEVIEHLPRWRELVEEARRALKPAGVFLVSTPNKAYYEESRAEAGPNPFHHHEFEYEEFRAALGDVFPHVRMWTQNHAESIVFAPVKPDAVACDAGGDEHPELAHFFIAACSAMPVLQNELYAWLPSTANVLREREHHITKLEGELAKKDAWLNRLVDDHAKLKSEHDITLAELKERAEWNGKLNAEIAERRARIEALQEENEQRLEWLRRTEETAKADAASRLRWIAELEARIAAGNENALRQEQFIESLQADLAAREAWGQSLNAQFHEKAVQVQQLWTEVQELRAVRSDLEQLQARFDQAARELEVLHLQRAMIAGSKWVRLGRKLNVGPVVDGV